MIKILRKCSFIMSCLLPFNGVAGPYPIVTDLKISNYSSSGGVFSWVYTFGQTVIEAGNIVDTPVPYSHLALSHKHAENGGSFVGSVYGSVSIDNHTWSTAAMDAYAAVGSVTSLFHSGDDSTEECVGYMGYNVLGEPWSDSHMPLYPLCVQAPPVDNSCQITPVTIEINHETLRFSNVSGSIKEAEGTINCIRPATISLHIAPSDIPLAPNLDSTLSFPGGSQMDIPVGGKSFSIRSTLRTSGPVESGSYSGNAVVYLSYD